VVSASGRRLDVFRTIIERGGVNAAADHLGVSQPSITAHVRALERQVGASLFKRQRGRRNVVTPAGEALYLYACESAAHRSELTGKLRGLASQQANSLSLAVQRSIANYTMPAVLAAFLRAHPTARITMHSETQEAVRDLAVSGRVDAAILFGTGDDGAPTIGRQDLVLIAAANHPLARRKRVGVSELDAYAFVGGLPSSQFFGLVETALHRAGVRNYQVILHLQDSVAVKNAVLQGIGIACTLACVVEQEIESGRLVVLRTDVSLHPLPIEYILPAVSPSPLWTAFLDVWRKEHGAPMR
jgi:DNA-binding transcriptional LysR family regulator